jgi:hypothetical protein
MGIGRWEEVDIGHHVLPDWSIQGCIAAYDDLRGFPSEWSKDPLAP